MKFFAARKLDLLCGTKVPFMNALLTDGTVSSTLNSSSSRYFERVEDWEVRLWTETDGTVKSAFSKVDVLLLRSLGAGAGASTGGSKVPSPAFNGNVPMGVTSQLCGFLPVEDDERDGIFFSLPVSLSDPADLEGDRPRLVNPLIRPGEGESERVLLIVESDGYHVEVLICHSV